MSLIEKRPSERGYRARYRDPLGEQRSKTFARKADAQRFLLEMESEKARGSWIDPRGAEMPLATWAAGASVNTPGCWPAGRGRLIRWR